MSGDKFIVPVSGIDVIPRAGLDGRLIQSVIDHVITWVIAPAGSGKSVTMARIFGRCHEASYRPVWYSCDEADKNDTHFLSQLELAIHTGDSLRNASHDSFPDNLASSIRRLGEPVVLFMDNYDACETELLNTVLLRLLQLCGANLKIVLSSRIAPKMQVASLRMKSQIGEFSRQDLSIDADEIERFINVEPNSLTDQQKNKIIAKTEGWVAALQFIRLLVGRGASVDQIVNDISLDDKNIRKFLYEEVFKTLSLDIKKYLISISHLDKISPDLSVKVLGDQSAYNFYMEMLDRNLFVIPLDSARQWVKIHSVFRDFLILEARRGSPDVIRQSLGCAAQWHWDNGDWLAAVNYAIDADKPYLAAEWLQSCGEMVVTDRGEVAAFRLCCERLVDTGVAPYDLVQWMVWTAAFSTSWMDASNLLSRYMTTQDMVKQARDKGNISRTMLLDLLLSFFSHDFERTIGQCHAWWDQSKQDTAFDRATVAAMMAFSYKVTLRQPMSRMWLHRAREEVANSTGGYGRMWVHAISAYMSLVDGKPKLAQQEAKQALVDHATSPTSAAILEPILAEAAYELDDLELAERYAGGNVAGAEGCAALDIAFNAYKVSALLRFKKVGPEETLMLIDNWVPHVTRRFGNRGFAMLQLLKRDIICRVGADDRARLVHQFNMGVDDKSEEAVSPDLMERAQLISAREQLMAGNPSAALELVKPILLSTRHDGRLPVWTEASIVKAAALKANGEQRRGERLLLETLTKVAPVGICRTILDLSILLRPFASFFSDDNAALKYLDHDIKNLFKRVADKLGMRTNSLVICDEMAPVEALTGQESKILNLLAEGLTNAEICDQLMLSTATVKWHIYNMFQKLNVHSRTAAVREGRMQGLLS